MDLKRLVIQLQALREKGKALGLFTDTRDLLECDTCGLQEDVVIDGRLITHEQNAPNAPDIGLRFTELPSGQFTCPRCGTVLWANDI